MNHLSVTGKTTSTAPALHFAVMRVQDVEEVVAVENQAYPFPWTRGNFLDSLASRYDAWTLRESDARLAGYFLLMHAVDETHLLNITVRPDLHGRGFGRVLLDKVIALAHETNIHSVLLEVRPSNEHALAVYRHCGVQQIGSWSRWVWGLSGPCARAPSRVFQLKSRR